jgi:SWI/SNF-related matrix-associated actin-dependent regulator 1 of chromatin subfamily A
MGTGKTVQTLVALPENAAVLVVCPSVVKRNWEAEAAKWRPDFKVVVLSGRKSFRMPKEGELVIVNFDILPSDIAHRVDQARVVMTGKAYTFTLVVDEAHYCKNKKTKRHNACHALSAAAERTWLLSGTPMTNQPFDLLSVLRVAGLDRTVFGGFNRFLQLFQGRKGRWGGYEFGTPDPEVAERLRRVSIRRTLDEVMPDLPRHRYQSIEVNGIPKALAKELDEVGEDYGDLFDMGELPPFEELSEVRKKLAACRTEAMLKLIEEYEETETPVLVFSAHRYPIDSLNGREGWATITGDTSAEERQVIVRRFQDGELRGVGLTIAAGGVGITLTHASTSIFVDLDWTPANNAQAEDRIRRIGQKASSLLCIRLTSTHPVDKRVQELLEEKTERFRIAIESKLEAEEVERIDLTDESEADRLARIEAWERAAREVVEREYTDKIETVLDREEARSFGKGGKPLPVKAPTGMRAVRVKLAFDTMLGMCDGAIEEDGVGFNKIDAALAHWLPMSGLDLGADERALRLMHALVVRYPAQVGDILEGS